MRAPVKWFSFGIIAALALFALLASSPAIQPRVEIQVQSNTFGKSQMYFAASENDFAEARSQVRPLAVGVNTLRFPFGLARGTVGDFHRWDPNDEPSEFLVQEVVLRSAFLTRSIPLEELRPSIAVSEIALTQGGAAFRTDSNDGQILLNVPARNFYFINLLLTAIVAGVATSVGFLLIRSYRSHRRRRINSRIGVPSLESVSPQVLTAARAVSVIAVALVILRYAWLSDDALITIRTALNAVNGYGPNFNIDERVQAFTHPLWFGLITAIGWLTGQWMATPMLLGVVTTTAAVFVVTKQVSIVSRLVVFTTALLVSNAFVEYSTSGLENGLSYLLLAGLLVLVHKMTSAPNWGRYVAVGTLTGGLLLNRLDLVLVVLPVGLYVSWTLRAHVIRVISMVAIAGAVVGSWLAVSYFYYGSILPTTFTAKTNVDIPRSEMVLGGIRYLGISFINDPATFVVLGGGTLLALLAGGMITRFIVLGVGLYLTYVAWIGGDFMAGRFLAVPVFVVSASLVLERTGVFVHLIDARFQSKEPDQASATWGALGAAIPVALLLIVGWGRSDVFNADLPESERWDFVTTGGVSDERGFYIEAERGLWQFIGTLRPVERLMQQPREAFVASRSPDLVDLQFAAVNWPRNASVTDVEVICGRLGERGIMGGPSLHLVDPCGLTDPFLASLPFESQGFDWRAGHFERALPDGYLKAIRSNDPTFVTNESLREGLIEIWRRVR